MTEDEVINTMMALTERLAADVHELSSQISDLTHTVNTLRREVDHIPVRSCQLARRLEETNNPPTKGDTHG